MYSQSIGDQTRAFQMARSNNQLKTQMDRLVAELSSGRIKDVSEAVNADFTELGSIEATLSRLDAYAVSLAETGAHVLAAQTVLGAVQDISSGLGPSFLLAGNTANPTQIHTAATDARQNLETVVSMLNTQVSGRSLFAGVATDRQALASSDEILENVRISLAGVSTAEDVVGVVNAWFENGGGFENLIYLGSQTPLGDRSIGPGETAGMPPPATDPAIKDVLKGLVLGALAAEGLPGLDIQGNTRLVQEAGTALLTAEGGLSNLRASIGATEAQIEGATARSVAERSALSLVRNGILASDPYQAASELEQISSQLETLYAMTSRLSRLSLADYLR